MEAYKEENDVKGKRCNTKLKKEGITMDNNGEINLILKGRILLNQLKF